MELRETGLDEMGIGKTELGNTGLGEWDYAEIHFEYVFASQNIYIKSNGNRNKIKIGRKI